MSYAVLEEFVYSLRRDLVSYPIPTKMQMRGGVPLGDDTFGRKKISPLTASIECQRRPKTWLCERQFYLSLASAEH